jgi:hypothetical protein
LLIILIVFRKQLKKAIEEIKNRLQGPPGPMGPLPSTDAHLLLKRSRKNRYFVRKSAHPGLYGQDDRSPQPAKNNSAPSAALRDVSFRAPDGAITGLLGANGAGKSTTLRTICGVLKPGSGQVLVDGISPPAIRSPCSGASAVCSITPGSTRA